MEIRRLKELNKKIWEKSSTMVHMVEFHVFVVSDANYRKMHMLITKASYLFFCAMHGAHPVHPPGTICFAIELWDAISLFGDNAAVVLNCKRFAQSAGPGLSTI